MVFSFFWYLDAHPRKYKWIITITYHNHLVTKLSYALALQFLGPASQMLHVWYSYSYKLGESWGNYGIGGFMTL